MLKRLYRGSLLFKITLLFILVNLLTTIVVFAVIAAGSQSIAAHVLQQLSSHIAEEFAVQLTPVLERGASTEEIAQKLDKISSQRNYAFDPFILSQDGTLKVIPSYIPGEEIRSRRIAVEPIEYLLAQKELPAKPIKGLSPLKLHQKKQVFSAAPIIYQGKPAYLYVMLFSRKTTEVNEKVAKKAAFWGLVQLGIVAFLITSSLGALVAFFATRRFYSVLTGVQQLRSDTLNNRIELKGSDELSQLASAINEMAEALELSTEEVKEREAERRVLIANISHDLRGPVTAALGMLEALKNKGESLSEEERSRYLDIIYDSLQQEHRLAEDLFELSKLEATNKPLESEVFSLSELISDVVVQNEFQAQSKGIRLGAERAEGSPMVYADPVLIGRALTNLIENAIRYSNKGDSITVGLNRSDDKLIVTVSDTGIGIPEEHKPFLFENFYRAHKDSAPGREGSGLGLAIVKRIVDMHGGEIWVESEPGMGCSFFFSLAASAS